MQTRFRLVRIKFRVKMKSASTFNSIVPFILLSSFIFLVCDFFYDFSLYYFIFFKSPTKHTCKKNGVCLKLLLQGSPTVPQSHLTRRRHSTSILSRPSQVLIHAKLISYFCLYFFLLFLSLSFSLVTLLNSLSHPLYCKNNCSFLCYSYASHRYIFSHIHPF